MKMTKLDFKKLPLRIMLGVLLTLVLFGAVFSLVPLYGVNILPQSATGFSNTGGWFGNMVNPAYGYCGG
jgi:hypothetical protein